VPALSPRERVVVGVGAIVALLVGGYLFLVEPLMTRARDAEATVPVREATLERRRLLIAQRPRLAEELAAVGARLEAESARLLRGPTPPLAASELQKLVKDQLAGSNVEMRSERVLPPSDQQGLQEVAIEITIVGSIRETVSALARLERSDRLLALKEVKMRVVAVSQPRELLTTVTVAGYLLPGASTQTETRAEPRTAAAENR
jgi:type II secretory pathway component PulM